MLYVCATPIGNLEDITLRVLNTLKKVDYIACEDTRRTIKLLNHYDISKKLISINQHNEYERKNRIIDDLKEGKDIALVSDAGMPGIQDPGRILIEEVIKNQLPYTVLPGATAFVTALVGSGLCKDEFLFLGFLPRKNSERKVLLDKYSKFDKEIILYEAPHRFGKLLESIYESWGNRNIVISRELSKKFEEYIFTDIEEALNKHSKLKGEIVLIIEGKTNKEESDDVKVDINIDELVEEYLAKGFKTKELAKILVERANISKNEAYELALEFSKRKHDN